LRTAIDLGRVENKHATLDEEARLVSTLAAAEQNPELEYIKAEHRGEFTSAFREALASLSPRDRNLLRLHFVEGMPPEHIGALYRVHRTTVMRWLQAAQVAVLAETKRMLMERLHLSPSECDSLLQILRSRLQVTLSSFLSS